MEESYKITTDGTANFTRADFPLSGVAMMLHDGKADKQMAVWAKPSDAFVIEPGYTCKDVILVLLKYCIPLTFPLDSETGRLYAAMHDALPTLQIIESGGSVTDSIEDPQVGA